ncbi:MAG: transposase [Conexivisphaerales archaeon]
MPSGFKAGKKLIIPKFPDGIKYRDNSAIPKKQVIVRKDVDRYYASTQYETTEAPEKGAGIVGIDMGICNASRWIAGRTTEFYEEARKEVEKGTEKAVEKQDKTERAQKIYQQIRDIMTDFNHKVSSAIAKHYGTVIEGLNVQGTQQNHHLAKSIPNLGWYQFEEMLEYKLSWRNAELIEIGRYESSSKMCSECGNVKLFERIL